jgi:hypothetical protein
MRCEDNAPNNLQAVRDRSGKDGSGQCLEDNHLVDRQPDNSNEVALNRSCRGQNEWYNNTSVFP